jgi:glutathione S-transferase
MTSTVKLWHCHDSRSMRPLWALEEMGIDYELVKLPFPPRVFDKEYLGVNVLGTVPYFTHDTAHMTESTGICHYLVEKFQQYDFGLKPDHPEYGDYLNWLYHSDATLTFPQTIAFRYTMLEPPERQLPQAAEDYSKWYIARLRKLDAHIKDREFLVDDKFTIADIAVTFALYFGELLNLNERYTPQVLDYLARMKDRPAFQKIQPIGKEMSPFN